MCAGPAVALTTGLFIPGFTSKHWSLPSLEGQVHTFRMDESERRSYDEEMKRKANEARHEKSHKAAATVGALLIGTLGTAVIGTAIDESHLDCLGGVSGPNRTDPWCIYVNSSFTTDDPKALIIGAILAGIGYLAVYVLAYLFAS